MANGDKPKTAIDHLIGVIGLCQTSRESWSSEDNKAFREAREFVQQHIEDKSEGKREETSTAAIGNSATQPNAGATAEGIQREGVPVKTGTERATEPEG